MPSVHQASRAAERMRIVLLDDYQDAVRSLAAFGKLDGHTVHVYNDTAADRLCVLRGDQRLCFAMPALDPALLHADAADESRVARPGFARGLCLIDAHTVASGSSPSTITLHDLESRRSTLSVVLSGDVRNAIHGLEVWPFALRETLIYSADPRASAWR